ncbi:hypothetical protein VULLAG_LOCUS8816 [Vulpes lagopus]
MSPISPFSPTLRELCSAPGGGAEEQDTLGVSRVPPTAWDPEDHLATPITPCFPQLISTSRCLFSVISVKVAIKI